MRGAAPPPDVRHGQGFAGEPYGGMSRNGFTIKQRAWRNRVLDEIAMSRRELILVNDNDFGIEGVETRFYRVSFERPIVGEA